MVWALLNEAQSKGLHEIVESKSDRVAAILGAAMLDDSLRRALEFRFRPSSLKDRVFEFGGGLGNTPPKIHLAYLLYMIDKPMMQAMEAISDIRNAFAHNLTIALDDPGVRMSENFNKLQLHKGLTHYPHPFTDGPSEQKIERAIDRRDQFMVNLKLVLVHLMRDFRMHAPNSNFPPPLASVLNASDAASNT